MVSTEQQLSTSIQLSDSPDLQPMLDQVMGSPHASPWGYTENAVWRAREDELGRQRMHRGKPAAISWAPHRSVLVHACSRDPTDVVVCGPWYLTRVIRVRARIALSCVLLLNVPISHLSS